MEKKYTVKEFVDKFENNFADSELNIYKEEIGKVYISLAEKTARAKMIVDSSYYVKKDGKSEFYMNTPANYMLSCLNIVDMYSPISIDFKNSLEEFDLLSESGVMAYIISCVSEKELSEFKMICDAVGDDEVRNYHEIYGFAER